MNKLQYLLVEAVLYVVGAIVCLLIIGYTVYLLLTAS